MLGAQKSLFGLLVKMWRVNAESIVCIILEWARPMSLWCLLSLVSRGTIWVCGEAWSMKQEELLFSIISTWSYQEESLFSIMSTWSYQEESLFSIMSTWYFPEWFFISITFATYQARHPTHGYGPVWWQQVHWARHVSQPPRQEEWWTMWSPGVREAGPWSKTCQPTSPTRRMVNCVKSSCQRRWLVRILAWQVLVSVIIMFLAGRAMSLFFMFENEFMSGVLIIGFALPPMKSYKSGIP